MKVRELLEGPRELGASEWILVEQSRIDRFADATDDHQWIHVDPARASLGPFGGTIAHGFLVLSLVPLGLEPLLAFEDQTMGINYGINRVRFTAPVGAGSRARVRAEVVDATTRGEGVLATLKLQVEVDGQDAPALVGEFLLLAFD